MGHGDPGDGRGRRRVLARRRAVAPPWDGNPISAGLGPTYGEAWCANAAPGSSIANQQKQPLALIPYEAIECTLQQFEDEAARPASPTGCPFK